MGAPQGVDQPIPRSPQVLAFVDEGLGNSSYLIEVAEGRALAVDPSRDPRPYLRAAGDRDLQIAWVAETHLHADFVSGSRELAREGATVLAARAAGLGFPHDGLEDGEELDLGGLHIRALATPGHTPEHLSFVVFDGSSLVGVFTGGALLPGGAARTDLIAPEQTEALARSLYRSIRGGLLTLPDETRVYPTHGGGSFCSVATTGDRTTTIGREREANPLLACTDEDSFVGKLLGNFGTYPTYFGRLREVNRRGPELYGEDVPTLPKLGPDEVRRLVADGAELVDVRPIADFARGHVPGALSIVLGPAFATWLGWLVDPDQPLVFVVNPDQDRHGLIRQCLKVAYERFAGWTEHASWCAAGFGEARIVLDLASHATGTILDVRQDNEFIAGHLPGAIHVELGALPAADGLPRGSLALMCGHGERAVTAASLLERAGRSELTVLLGGPTDWSTATGRPLERP